MFLFIHYYEVFALIYSSKPLQNIGVGRKSFVIVLIGTGNGKTKNERISDFVIHQHTQKQNSLQPIRKTTMPKPLMARNMLIGLS